MVFYWGSVFLIVSFFCLKSRGNGGFIAYGFSAVSCGGLITSNSPITTATVSGGNSSNLLINEKLVCILFQQQSRDLQIKSRKSRACQRKTIIS